jgi:hypothetical protein
MCHVEMCTHKNAQVSPVILPQVSLVTAQVSPVVLPQMSLVTAQVLLVTLPHCRPDANVDALAICMRSGKCRLLHLAHAVLCSSTVTQR